MDLRRGPGRNACTDPALAGTERIRTSGGHHFDGDYEALARAILEIAQRRGPGGARRLPDLQPADDPGERRSAPLPAQAKVAGRAGSPHLPPQAAQPVHRARAARLYTTRKRSAPTRRSSASSAGWAGSTRSSGSERPRHRRSGGGECGIRRPLRPQHLPGTARPAAAPRTSRAYSAAWRSASGRRRT